MYTSNHATCINVALVTYYTCTCVRLRLDEEFPNEKPPFFILRKFIIRRRPAGLFPKNEWAQYTLQPKALTLSVKNFYLFPIK